MKPKTKSSKKAKNGPNVKEPSSESKESLQDDNAMQLLDVAIMAINITKDLVPIDLAKGILGTVTNILIIAQSVIKNKSDFQAIVDKCETIREILERATKHATNDDLRGYLGHALSQLNKSVNHINSEVASKKEQGFWQRLLSVTSDRDRIAGWEKDLDRVIPLFSAEMLVGLTIGMNAWTLGLKDNVHGNVERYHPPVPPSRPSMFYGREDLIAELTNLLPWNTHFDAPERHGLAHTLAGKTANIKIQTADNHTLGAWFILSELHISEAVARLTLYRRYQLSSTSPICVQKLKREIDEESDQRLLEAQTKLYNLDRKIEASSSSKRARQIICRKLKEVDKIRTEEDRFTLGSFNNEDERQRAIDRVRDLGIDQDNLRYQLEQANSETFASNLDEFEKNSDPITKEMVANTAMYYTFIPAAETRESSEILKVADRLSTVVRTTLFAISDSIDNFWNKVVVQPEAVEAIANTVQYMPIASFLFGGPSGSGKTLLVKGLSEIALRQSGKLLRINASDYIEPHSLTRLIGTPACTGYDYGVSYHGQRFRQIPTVDNVVVRGKNAMTSTNTDSYINTPNLHKPIGDQTKPLTRISPN
ncbi:hypothetical protein EV424DRAFT_1553749 [Suillus variegatus]|nr:hypothetical protein EV424DRAFT_1553749 [Suillus variegatus]